MKGENPAECVQRLAELKMRAALEMANRMGFSHDQIILASDTVVAFEGVILGKPKNEKDAISMLKKLRGQVHQVYTGINITRVDSSESIADICTSDVPMRNYTDDEIMAYMNTGDPMDKAGSYAIQHPGFHPVETFHHCYASVMGLPLCHVSRSLHKLGIKIYEDIPVACQEALDYTCPVFAEILAPSEMK